jgi:hypothetical protein
MGLAGMAWRGKAWQGSVWRGEDWQGNAGITKTGNAAHQNKPPQKRKKGSEK